MSNFSTLLRYNVDKEKELIPGQDHCVVSAHYPYVCMDFLRVLWVPPSFQRRAHLVN